MPNIIKRAASKASGIVVKRYNTVQARKQAFEAKKEENKIFEDITNKRAESEYRRGYAENYRSKAYERGKAKAEGTTTEEQSQGGRAGKLRRSVSEGLTGLSLGSANALKNDMYGVGKVDFGGFDSLTMGGPAGAGTLRNLEDITGFGGPRAKPKQLNPAVQGQSRGNIVINVGSSGSNKKRKPAAQIPQKQRDWQDDLEKLTGF
jgi:hypothetical protein